MSLTYALAPECIILSIGKDCIRIQSVQRKHSRVPAYRNDSNMSALRGCLVYICKMLRYPRMGIKAVYNVEPLCIFRSLLWKICSTSSTENQNIYLVFHFFCFIYMVNSCCLCKDFDSCRITACKNCYKFKIRIMFDRTFYTSSKITIT